MSTRSASTEGQVHVVRGFRVGIFSFGYHTSFHHIFHIS